MDAGHLRRIYQIEYRRRRFAIKRPGQFVQRLFSTGLAKPKHSSCSNRLTRRTKVSLDCPFMTSFDPHGDWQAKAKATMAPANAFVGRRLMGLDAFDAGSDQRQAPNHHWHTDRAVPGAH